MKKLIGVATGILLVLALVGTSMAAPLLYDDFNSENSGVGVLNYSGFANWTVSDGTVDLIGQGTSWDLQPGNGLYVDLDGSTSNAGIMTSKNQFFFANGTDYVLSFDIAGSQRGDDTSVENVNVTVAAGSLFNLIYVVGTSVPFTRITEEFTGNDSWGYLSFANFGGDNIGALLDNVTLDVASAPVPEPATMLLLGSGLVGLAGLRRKFKK